MFPALLLFTPPLAGAPLACARARCGLVWLDCSAIACLDGLVIMNLTGIVFVRRERESFKAIICYQNLAPVEVSHPPQLARREVSRIGLQNCTPIELIYPLELARR